MSEFTSEGSQAADEEVENVRSEPNRDPLTEPGAAAEGQPTESDEREDDR
ncbi:hypothetical protein [Microlunatus ginsengisoli]|uniref:Nucleotide exchange factor GrpE n=1 Tax=Microlunatus ginsengisoli TaxID=363863 RepID=A0ABP6ZFM2_9ACTN